MNRSAIALKFSSSWSMSVMLGTVVAMPGFLMAHLSAADGEIGRPRQPRAPPRPDFGHHLHGDHADAGLVQLLDRGPVARGRSEIVLRLHHLDLGFDYPVDNRRQVVGAHADEPNLALLFGLALRLHQLVGDLRRIALP